MPEYLTPGVYVEEIDAGPKPIEGVSTSTTGAVGVTAFGPTDGKPELVTSFADFMRKFGGFLPEPPSATFNKWALNPTDGGRYWLFPLSVKGFFDNRGQRLYVKRAFASTAVAASARLGSGMVADVIADAAAAATVVKLSSLINIYNTVAIHIFRGDTQAEIGGPGGFTVSSYNEGTGRVWLSAALPEALLAKRGDFVEVHARTAAPVSAANTTLLFQAKSRGDWGNDLSVRVQPMVGSTLNILYNPGIAGNAQATTTVTNVAVAAGPPVVTTLTVASVAGLANADHIQINGAEYALSNLSAANRTFDITPNPSAAIPVGAVVRRLRKANTANAGATINVAGAAVLYKDAFVELANGQDKETFNVVSVNGDTVTLDNTLTKAYFEGHKMRVIETQVNVDYEPIGLPAVTESFSFLRLVDDGSPSYIARNLELSSNLVKVTAGAALSIRDLTRFPCAPSGGFLPLSGGDDKESDLTVDDFVGVDGGSGKRTGIQALEDIDEVSICLVPNIWASTVQSALIQHCEILKDRFAILDPQDGLSIEGIRAVREPIDTKYAAIYYPWVEVRDPSVRRNVYVAPSGHMAGIYARVDVERGVHKAPANEVIRGISKIAQDVTDREQAMLNPKGINALRFFANRGNRVWGARTLSSDSSWKYINVRRLFIFVEESIDEGTQFVVFEPNSDPTWARVRQTITNFLTTVWRSGALEGTKPDEAFFVKCDRTTMSQDDIDNGKLICVIGIAPVKPAEFVIFRIQQKTLTTS